MLLRQNYWCPGSWCCFGCFLFPAFRLPMGLALIGWRRRATLRPLLRLLSLLWRRRLAISALHSFSLVTRLTRWLRHRKAG